MRRSLAVIGAVAVLLVPASGMAMATQAPDPASQPRPVLSADTDPGSLVVTTTGPAGLIVTDACLELWTDAGGGTRGSQVSGQRHCDTLTGPDGKPAPADDRFADGTLAFTGVAPGRYVLVETRAPVDFLGRYGAVADRPVQVIAGKVARETLLHVRVGALTLTKVDPTGAPLPGACFELDGGPKLGGVALCDGDPGPGGIPGDGWADGLLVLTTEGGLPKGQYILRELRPPPGYAAVADGTVTLVDGVAATLTVTDRLAPAGSGTNGPQVIVLELEIDSTIDLSNLNGVAVNNGRASASGRIRLAQDAAGDTWSGTGSLTSVTTSDAGGCPSILVTGEGIYDWVVRGVVASPETPVAGISVSMDSGPITESPDAFTMDMCSGTFDGTLNTWENLFFGVHNKDFKSMGFLVDRWQPVDADAWTGGGIIAEARWSGECAMAATVCSEATTFRLYGVVIPGAPGASPTTAPGGAGPSASSDAVPAPSSSELAAAGSPANSAIALPGDAASCIDASGCPETPTGIIAVVVILAAIAAVVAGTLWLRTRGPTPPTLAPSPPIQPPPVDSVPGSTLDYDKLDYTQLPPIEGPLSYDKVGPIEPGGDIKIPDGGDLSSTEPLTYEKHPPTGGPME